MRLFEEVQSNKDTNGCIYFMKIAHMSVLDKVELNTILNNERNNNPHYSKYFLHLVIERGGGGREKIGKKRKSECLGQRKKPTLNAAHHFHFCIKLNL